MELKFILRPVSTEERLDFYANKGERKISINQDSRIVPFRIREYDIKEELEIFEMLIYDVTNSVVQDSNGDIRIKDND